MRNVHVTLFLNGDSGNFTLCLYCCRVVVISLQSYKPEVVLSGMIMPKFSENASVCSYVGLQNR